MARIRKLTHSLAHRAGGQNLVGHFSPWHGAGVYAGCYSVRTYHDRGARTKAEWKHDSQGVPANERQQTGTLPDWIAHPAENDIPPEYITT